MANNTREKILDAAKTIFNENGFGAVTLHELAQNLGMSRGNLTYHFKNKELLLNAIAEEMWNKVQASRNESRQFPSFENLRNKAQSFYAIQKDYAFIFLDSQVLKYSTIKQQLKALTKEMIADHKAAIAFSIKLGNMRPEPIPGLYNNIALITWNLYFFWFSQQATLGEQQVKDPQKLIWSILIPHFTEKGINAFISFFGEDYYQSLGQPFEHDMNSLITF